MPQLPPSDLYSPPFKRTRQRDPNIPYSSQHHFNLTSANELATSVTNYLANGRPELRWLCEEWGGAGSLRVRLMAARAYILQFPDRFLPEIVQCLECVRFTKNGDYIYLTEYREKVHTYKPVMKSLSNTAEFIGGESVVLLPLIEPSSPPTQDVPLQKAPLTTTPPVPIPAYTSIVEEISAGIIELASKTSAEPLLYEKWSSFAAPFTLGPEDIDSLKGLLMAHRLPGKVLSNGVKVVKFGY